jgi:hypothetical protein
LIVILLFLVLRGVESCFSCSFIVLFFLLLA